MEISACVPVGVDLCSALINLYDAMKAAASNGTGYSPLVAEAMKRIEQFEKQKFVTTPPERGKDQQCHQ